MEPLKNGGSDISIHFELPESEVSAPAGVGVAVQGSVKRLMRIDGLRLNIGLRHGGLARQRK